MSARCYQRGHRIYYSQEWKCWVYSDTNTPADDSRACTVCHRFPTPEGYDPCLGEIPGAISACCGHGETYGFILKEDGTLIPMSKLYKEKEHVLCITGLTSSVVLGAELSSFPALLTLKPVIALLV